VQAAVVHDLGGRGQRVPDAAHAVGRRHCMRHRQVVHEERVRRHVQQAQSARARTMGRVVKVLTLKGAMFFPIGFTWIHFLFC
jgi:hypothetical protein